jgi:glycosyltransferase involved in cell wall biosynthesis
MQSKTNKIRILHVYPYMKEDAKNAYSGGVGRCIELMARGYDRGKYEMSLVISDTIDEFLPGLDIKTFKIRMRHVRRSRNPIKWLLDLISFTITVAQLVKMIKEERIDVVHSQTGGALYSCLAAKMAGIKCVQNIREYRIKYPKITCRIIVHYLNLFADRIICDAKMITDLFVVSGKPISKAVTLHNAVDLIEYDPGISGDRVRREFGIGKDQPVVGFVGRFDPYKGIEYFIEAARRIAVKRPDVRFLLVGGLDNREYAPYQDKILSMAKTEDLKDKLILTGVRRDLPNVLAAMDIFVFPSVFDSGPRIPLEAMAMGKPVIATNSGGVVEEVADGETGIIVPIKDPDAIASAALSLLDDPQILRIMGRNARSRIEKHFSQGHYISVVEDIYQDLLRS